jgi:uncharacterized RDD family membrane protein YckC
MISGDNFGAGFAKIPDPPMRNRMAAYTGLMRRLAAILYDTLLVAALLFLATVPFVALRGGEPVEVGDNAIYRITLVIVVYGFFVGFWTRSGRTLGMQSWGLQLETTRVVYYPKPGK